MFQFGEQPSESYEQQVAVDPQISQWEFAEDATGGAERSANMFDQEHAAFVNLANIEHASPGCITTGSTGNPYVGYWGEREGVQQMPSNEGQSEQLDRA